MNADTATIDVSLRSSWRLSSGLAGVHVASAILVFLLDLSWGIATPVLIALAGHGAWAVRRFGWLASGASVTGIALQLDHECSLRYRDGTFCTGRIDDSTLVTGWLVVIGVSRPPRGRTRRVAVTPDMLAAEDFRRLRVALRWGQPAQIPGATQV
ncbi:MAG: protein YgfX [Betaproteobacteria bacterium]